MHAFVQEQVDGYMKRYKEDIRDKVVELGLVTSTPVVQLLQYIFDHKPTLVLSPFPSLSGSSSTLHSHANGCASVHIHPTVNTTQLQSQSQSQSQSQFPSSQTQAPTSQSTAISSKKRVKSQISSSASVVHAHKRQPSTYRCTYTCPQSKKTCLKKKQGDSMYCKCHHQMMVTSKSSSPSLLNQPNQPSLSLPVTSSESTISLFTEQIGGITYALDEYGNVYDMAHALQYRSVQVGTYEKDVVHGVYVIHLREGGVNKC